MKTLVGWYKKVPWTKHKYIEFEIHWITEFWHNYFDLSTSWTRKVDHAGFRFILEIYRFTLCFHVYDCRHWDHAYDCWVDTDNQENENYI